MLQRLCSVYIYDLAGNRLTKTKQDATSTEETAYTYNELDQLIDEVFSVDGVAQSTTNYGYDDNGAQINKSIVGGQAVTYDYNLQGRLSAADTDADGANDVFYLYDETGIRVSKTEAGQETLYLVDPNNPTGYAQVLEELTPGGVLVASFVFGHAPISQFRAGVDSFYLLDHHSGVRLLTDSAALVTDTYLYYHSASYPARG